MRKHLPNTTCRCKIETSYLIVIGTAWDRSLPLHIQTIYNMLPLSLLKTAQGHPMLVELKNGETYNGHLVNCDTWMNIHLREVICTSKDGDRFWRMPECYIRGNTIKYLRVPDEVIDKVQEETKSRTDRKPPGVGRGRGRGGREEGPAGRPAKGIGRGIDEGGRGQGVSRGGRGGLGGKPGANRGAGRGFQWFSRTYGHKNGDIIELTKAFMLTTFSNAFSMFEDVVERYNDHFVMFNLDSCLCCGVVK
ncbi:hypothetical protein RIF29_23190 [Crotalaria pallida]|uniref:U6 snRNA-associated Sm-like protein LSm4 n=1 Tax=Crotalaria pallida TaxID=3830 RepID=A0AAN9F5D2_CROPI